MSGLFGLVSTDNADIHPFLNMAGKRMSHRSWYVTDTWVCDSFPLGLGRMGIGILNRESQPVVSSDGQLVLFMTGEFYNRDELHRHLESLNTPLPVSTDAELALILFQHYGPEFVRRLEGMFFIVVYDQTQQRLIFANDRYSLYPHYYFIQDGKLAFAPEVKGVLCAPFVPRNLNVTAAAEYFRFQQLLGDKTFHEGIYHFPYGSVAQFDLTNRAWSLTRYWDWDQVPDRPEVRFDEAVIEVGRLLRRAVEKRTAGELRPGVFLSGGLDSRVLLGLMPPRTPPPVSASFGQKHSRDAYYAAQIARAVGSRHFWFDMPDGRWILENVDFHLQLTEGFHSWIHMHGINMLPQLRNVMDYNLSGWDGGTVMATAGMSKPIYTDPVDKMALLALNFKEYVSDNTWPGLLEAEERMLYTDEFGKQAIGRAFESLSIESDRFWELRRQYAAELFFVVSQCWRMTKNMITIARSHMEVRTPFWDYDLIDFLYSLKPEIRRDRILYRHVLSRETPRLALIPYDRDEFLPSGNSWLREPHALLVRARKRLNLYPKRPTLYADYENYLRGDLRSWAENILYDKRTEDRGILNLPFVKSLMRRHLSGYEEWTIGKIAPLITFEMVMREYFD